MIFVKGINQCLCIEGICFCNMPYFSDFHYPCIWITDAILEVLWPELLHISAHYDDLSAFIYDCMYLEQLFCLCRCRDSSCCTYICLWCNFSFPIPIYVWIICCTDALSCPLHLHIVTFHSSYTCICIFITCTVCVGPFLCSFVTCSPYDLLSVLPLTVRTAILE